MALKGDPLRSKLIVPCKSFDMLKRIMQVILPADLIMSKRSGTRH